MDNETSIYIKKVHPIRLDRLQSAMCKCVFKIKRVSHLLVNIPRINTLRECVDIR